MADVGIWGNFWAATTAAATIATAVSTGVTLWLQKRNEPTPHWVITGDVIDHRAPGDPPEPFHGQCNLQNAGDGIGYSVEVRGVNCAVGYLRNMPVAKFDPDGEPARLWIDVAYPIPSNARIEITWIASPVRLRRRWVQTIWVDESVAVSGESTWPGMPPLNPMREHRPIRLPREAR